LELARIYSTIQISYKSSQRILDANDESLKIDRTSYYHINRRFLRLGKSQKRNELDKVLETLAETEFDYRSRYYYKIAKSGSVKKKTDLNRYRAVTVRREVLVIHWLAYLPCLGM
jgi:hypothetical protein